MQGPRSRRGLRWWLAVVGLGVLLALPSAINLARLVHREAALRHGISTLQPGDRSVTVSIVDSTGEAQYDTLDDGVVSALRPMSRAGPIQEVIYREATDSNGGGFVLGGADSLGRLIRLTAGRLPAECQPTRCEVVQVGDSTSTTFDPILLESQFGLVVVGHADRINDLLLSGTFQPDRATPLLVGDGRRAVTSVAALKTHGRTYGWVVPVDSVRVVDVGGEQWLKRMFATSDALDHVHPFLVFTVPSDTVIEQARRAESPASRVWLGPAVGITLLALAGLVSLAGMRAGGVVAAAGIAAAFGFAVCGLVAAHSPIERSQVVRSFVDGLPVASVMLIAASASLVASELHRRRTQRQL
jgi:hypothetical protein